MAQDPHASGAFPGIVAGRYRLLRELGRGGMGAVYEAEHANTGERVALKTMLIGSDDKEFVERFRREARAFAKIGGEHVVRVIDADVAPELDGAPFLVMELLNGSDLSRMLETQGRLSPDLVVKYLSQTGAAIERAHAAGLIHRDLKPENIFVHRTVEGREIVKVLDFGIAKAFEHTALTKPGALVGTPHYMAPEQARGETDAICPQTDVWALGMIALELLTGEPFWKASSIVQLFTQILTEPMGAPSGRWTFLPRGFDAWFARSCAREIRSRWPSVREQMDGLRAALRAGAVNVEYDFTDVAPRPVDVVPMPAQPHREQRRVRDDAPPTPNAARRELEPVAPVPARPKRPALAVEPPPPLPMGNGFGLLGNSRVQIVFGILLACALLALGALLASGTGGEVPIAVVPTTTGRPEPPPPSRGPPKLEPPNLDPVPSIPAAGSPSRVEPGCTTPYWFDGDGVKHYKPQCFDPPAAPDDLSKNPYRAATDQGFLTINVYPTASVSEGGRLLCPATPCNKIALSPGPHTLLLENTEQGMKQSTTVTIKSGETTVRAIGFK